LVGNRYAAESSPREHLNVLKRQGKSGAKPITGIHTVILKDLDVTVEYPEYLK